MTHILLPMIVPRLVVADAFTLTQAATVISPPPAVKSKSLRPSTFFAYRPAVLSVPL